MKTLAEKIAVMQAAAAGKRIRFRYLGKKEWFELTSPPGWDWVCMDYEVVPEPEVLFVNKSTGGISSIFLSKDDARHNATIYPYANGQ